MHIREKMRFLFWPLVSFRRIFLRKDSFLHKTGWYHSVKLSKPLTKEGEPIPWMNYAVISFLDERLNKSLVMFEFGSGYSTLFFASRVKAITSVEYDLAWFEKMKGMCPENAKILFTPVDNSGDYIRSVSSTQLNYDVIMIDGRDRVNCLKAGMKQLSERGVFILDDSHRKAYSEAFKSSVEQGFRHIHFEGLKPTGHEIERTTIFYRDGNCLGI